jgi:hypothetical protein
LTEYFDFQQIGEDVSACIVELKEDPKIIDLELSYEYEGISYTVTVTRTTDW